MAQRPDPSNEDHLLRVISDGIAAESGARFFRALVKHLSEALGTHGAWVTEYLPATRRLRALAFWLGGGFVEGYEYQIQGTPCELLLRKKQYLHIPDKVVELFPGDPSLPDIGAVSYIGFPLLDERGNILGNIAVVDTRPMPNAYRNLALFRIFAARATAELLRLDAEAKWQHAESILADLKDETHYLRDKVCELYDHCHIIGQSQALRSTLALVSEVSPTDSTVLLYGETGTGKELMARAIHAVSRRKDRPLVTVNCAAIPDALMESEFFGHERGAFTGATQRREGRFRLADGGTIFLDEVGELSLELQAKLLRVLQEGEYAPVGSSRNQKVDVRVVAATNRDLSLAVQQGAFRTDLYYRLNVFPITIPPLRERSEDIGLLSDHFVQKFATRMGRRIAPVSAALLDRLKNYAWPGNVRELHNVIERGVITARDGHLNLDYALPLPEDAPPAAPSPTIAPPDGQVLTVTQFQQLERRNLLLALRQCQWRVGGSKGAAQLLGMPPTTLQSRMKALGIERTK